jgi:hypothetical protein
MPGSAAAAESWREMRVRFLALASASVLQSLFPKLDW